MLLCCTYCCSSAKALNIIFIKSIWKPSIYVNRSQRNSSGYSKAVMVQLLSASLGQDVQEYPSTLKEFCMFYLKLFYDLQNAVLHRVPNLLCMYLCLLSSGSNEQLICMQVNVRWWIYELRKTTISFIERDVLWTNHYNFGTRSWAYDSFVNSLVLK